MSVGKIEHQAFLLFERAHEFAAVQVQEHFHGVDWFVVLGAGGLALLAVGSLLVVRGVPSRSEAQAP